jgi:hypothetical protein
MVPEHHDVEEGKETRPKSAADFRRASWNTEEGLPTRLFFFDVLFCNTCLILMHGV